MNEKLISQVMTALAKKSVEARKKKYGKNFSEHMRQIRAKASRKKAV